MVLVARRAWAFQLSGPESRPPPVSFSLPNAPPVSAPLGPAEPRLMVVAAGIAIVLLFFPRVIAYPLAFLAGWIAVTLLLQARRLRREGPANRRGKSSRRGIVELAA